MRPICTAIVGVSLFVIASVLALLEAVHLVELIETHLPESMHRMINLHSIFIMMFVGILIMGAALLEYKADKKKAENPESKPSSSTPQVASQDVEGSMGTIGFEYLPASPLQKGWKKAYTPEAQATFTTDHDIADSLQMETQGGFAMDHVVPPHAVLASRLRFTAKYTDTTMIFAYVDVSTKNGEQRNVVWLKIYYGEPRAIRTPGDWHNPQASLPEQTIYFPAQTLSLGRLMFDIDLREIVRQSIGDQGWVYKGIRKIRLRGDLSISPIAFA